MEEKYYAVLMNMQKIESEIYIFKPISIIQGEMLNNHSFIDDLETEYFFMEDVEILNSDEDLSVGYLIKEKDLLKKYPDSSISEAKAEYFEEISDYVHFGFCLDEKDKIVIKKVDFMNYFLKLINGEISEKLETLDFSDFDSITSEYNGSDVIAIGNDVFHELLNKNSLEEIKAELNKIYQGNQEIINHFESLSEEIEFSENMDSEQIEDYLRNIYQKIQNENNEEKVHSYLKTLEDFYLKLVLELDDNKKNSKQIEEFQTLLYKLIDFHHKINELSDVNSINIKLHQEVTPDLISMIAQKYDEIINSKETLETSFNDSSFFNVKEIKQYFDKVIIGQEEAKKVIISSIVMNNLENKRQKNICLLIGPTGSGKTLIAQTVSDYFSIPIVIVDTTQLTVPGYVGASNDDFIVQLIMKANGDIKKAEEGILVFDEIDKKGTEKNDDISGKGVLNTLLSLFQGTTYKVKYNGKEISFDTSKLTIFATGAFADVVNHKSINQGIYHDTNIGFQGNLKMVKEDIVYPKIEIDDLVKYGNMPIELIGRFSNIVQLTGHTKESLKTILTDSSESPLLAEKEKLEKLKIQLMWTEDYLEEIACYALNLKTGARSLKKCVEESIQEVRWEVLQNPQNYSGILMTKESVTDCLNCYLIDKNHQKHLLKELLNQDKIYVKTRGI